MSFAEMSEWRVKLSMGALIALAVFLWQAFTIHQQIHENEFNLERIEGRLDKKTSRLESQVELLEDRIRELEGCE